MTRESPLPCTGSLKTGPAPRLRPDRAGPLRPGGPLAHSRPGCPLRPDWTGAGAPLLRPPLPPFLPSRRAYLAPSGRLLEPSGAFRVGEPSGAPLDAFCSLPEPSGAFWSLPAPCGASKHRWIWQASRRVSLSLSLSLSLYSVLSRLSLLSAPLLSSDSLSHTLPGFWLAWASKPFGSGFWLAWASKCSEGFG